jgi:microcystin-dependent protein
VTYANLFAVIAISTTGTVTNGSPIITGIPTTVNMEIGFPVSGDNIPAASKILTVDGVDQITLDKNATGNGVANIQVCPFGVGNGLTTFNVPDSAGRAPIGAGSGSGLTKRYVGTVLGEETHQLTVGELATHGHNWSPAQQFVTTVSRTLNAYGTIAGTQAVVVTVSSTSGSVNNVPTNGSNTAHNTMQPSFVTLFIIKT